MMKTTFDQSEWGEKDGVYIYPHDANFPYKDTDESESKIYKILNVVVDKISDSDEWKQYAQDWVSQYHLSNRRAKRNGWRTNICTEAVNEHLVDKAERKANNGRSYWRIRNGIFLARIEKPHVLKTYLDKLEFKYFRNHWRELAAWKEVCLQMSAVAAGFLKPLSSIPKIKPAIFGNKYSECTQQDRGIKATS